MAPRSHCGPYGHIWQPVRQRTKRASCGELTTLRTSEKDSRDQGRCSPWTSHNFLRSAANRQRKANNETTQKNGHASKCNTCCKKIHTKRNRRAEVDDINPSSPVRRSLACGRLHVPRSLIPCLVARGKSSTKCLPASYLFSAACLFEPAPTIEQWPLRSLSRPHRHRGLH
jgi:hypothetical protein